MQENKQFQNGQNYRRKKKQHQENYNKIKYNIVWMDEWRKRREKEW